jgi:hypothetical protein
MEETDTEGWRTPGPGRPPAEIREAASSWVATGRGQGGGVASSSEGANRAIPIRKGTIHGNICKTRHESEDIMHNSRGVLLLKSSIFLQLNLSFINIINQTTTYIITILGYNIAQDEPGD